MSDKSRASRRFSIVDARTNLAEIIDFIEGGTNRAVYVGQSEDKALTAFISLEEFKVDQVEVYPRGSQDVDLEDLRQNWSSRRKVVEGIGQCLRIIRKSRPVAYLVPTSHAEDKIISPSWEIVENKIRENITRQFTESQISVELAKLQGVTERVSALSNNLPSVEEMHDFRKLIGLVRQILSDWRVTQNLPPIPI